MATKLIVGLGNPGSKYQWTRHNAGFMVLDRLADLAGIALTKKSFSGICGEGDWQGERLLLLKPQTFMNLSGRSVAEALRFHKLDIRDLVVFHDDLDLPFGHIKLKQGGGHAGHNGLRSMMQEMSDNGFLRIRIGIGRPPHGDGADYVLANFSREEQTEFYRVLEGSIEALRVLLAKGLAKTMAEYNGRNLLAE